MRVLMLALLGLTLAATPVLAAKRSGPMEAGRPAKQTAAAPALKAPPARTFARGRGARVQTAAQAPANCGRRGARHCRHAAVARPRFGWSHGLTPAAGVQANECPDGTMATLARGHYDVVRCMPI